MTTKEPGATQANRSVRVSQLVYDTDPGTAVGTPPKMWGVGAAEKTYAQNQFEPEKRDDQLSYTPGRMAKNVFNQYEENGYSTFCYKSDWGIGDPRYGEGPDKPPPEDYSTGGRGTDIMRLLGKTGTFDKIVVGFTAIVGDKGVNRDVINKAVINWGLSPALDPENPTREELDAAEIIALALAMFIDPWNDVAAFINCGFNGWKSNDYADLYDPAKAQGVLGALLKLQTANPGLKLSLSLGGWSMSHAFYHIARDPIKTARCIDSLVAIFTLWPMFNELDIDWEYPSVPGNEPQAGDTWKGNDFDDDDPAYFAVFIQALKTKLTAIGKGSVKISIAAIADPVKLAKSNIPLLIQAGLGGINLMCYDFFGTPWAPKIQHHCNLYRSDPADITENSVHSAVQYLLGLGVPSKIIFIGYAGYSRNAQQAVLTSVSPLVGTYTQRPGTEDVPNSTPGCFEPGITEWPGAMKHYLDLETKQPMNGFTLYTDEKADADFLYNRTTQVFMSLDTPRTVKAKGEYVLQWLLGGLFSWMGDHDNGLLNNAACEGVGRTVETQVIDMSPFYYKGATTLQP
ncbi:MULTISPECIES: glycosyl hydrolase family 18 protein [unclassified Pseudomonas]|uniref:glycosyl hydrolase family 18 protein n=1 Tax=unclassified Pseudomonas TaxID=196821 RepID=UPI000CCFE2EB|nr:MULTISPECIES: glycosyl hydrolase family 18 protein [unclassified Pseudomonas]POA34358.1 chitinase [Pseudomonas sp. GW456-R21]POA66467.1 chitinase [Pseudomonas sp. GW460-R15]